MTPAVDTHLHAHWPQRYAYSQPTGSRIRPEDVAISADGLFPALTAQGFSHVLIIQPGAYGNDNSAMLEAIARSEGRAKGIANMSLSAGDEEFLTLKSQGVVGVRLSLVHSLTGIFDHPEIETFLSRCRRHDFFVEIFAPAATWPQIIPQLRKAEVKIIVEHVGYPIVPDGVQQPGFQAVLELGRSSDAVIKLGSGFRLGQTGGKYPDVKPFALAVVEAFGPEKCIWGSDWPFLSPQVGSVKREVTWTIDYASEFGGFQDWITDAATRRSILWDTPARLFGFSEVGPKP
jgi:predicted TIM-barrel fold metal-dependent hydrolase